MTEPVPGANPPEPTNAPEPAGPAASPPSPGAGPPPGAAPQWDTTAPPSTSGGAAAVGAAQAQATSMLGRMSMPEQLAVLGAVLLLLVEIVTGLILDEYYAGDLVSLLAIAILVATWLHHGRGSNVPLGYVTVLKIAGFAIALIAVSDLVLELRRGVFDNVVDIVGGLAYYAGAVLVAIGAFQVKER